MKERDPFSKIAVFGGTPFDAQKGVDFLKSFKIRAEAVNMSQTPDEQSALYQNPEAVYQRFHDKIGNRSFSEIIFFCNSMSFVYPWQKMPETSIYELTRFYGNLLRSCDLRNTVVLVAEDRTSENLRKYAIEKGISNARNLRIDHRLDLIKQIEKASPEEQVNLVSRMLGDYVREGFSDIIFGCTHLDNPDFAHFEEIRVHQPGLMMIDVFVSDYYSFHRRS